MPALVVANLCERFAGNFSVCLSRAAHTSPGIAPALGAVRRGAAACQRHHALPSFQFSHKLYFVLIVIEESNSILECIKYVKENTKDRNYILLNFYSLSIFIERFGRNLLK